MKIDKKHDTKLAAARARDQKSRDHLVDSYITKLIRRTFPEFGREFAEENQFLIEAKRIEVFAKGYVRGNETPGREAAHKAFLKKLKQKLKRTASRKD